jgi:hypothetical protein
MPFATACGNDAALAPSGSTMVVSTSAADVPVNGTATLIAQLMKNGDQVPPDGTIVSFAATLGSVQPAQAPTAAGRATATFLAGMTSGTAVISARSQQDTLSIEGVATIAVGTAAASRVVVTANPPSVPYTGGSSSVTATVVDGSGMPLPTIPLTFSTTAGTLAPPTAKTDANGVAQVTLTTGQPATVTATIGATGSASGNLGAGTTGTVAVTVAPRPLPSVSITPSANPTAQAVTTFTISAVPAANSGTTIQNVSINFGDGSRAVDLGAGSGAGAVVAQHQYQSAGTFTVMATAVDSGGASASASAVIIVAAAQPLGVVIGAAPPVVGATSTIYTFTATATPATAVIGSYTWNFGDGSDELVTTGNQATHSFANGKGPYTVAVTAETIPSGRTADGFTIINP